MAASSRQAPAPYDGPWTRRARGVDIWLAEHKVVASATTASLVSTFAGFPLDSLKSRLQSSRDNIPLHRLAAEVIREEGVGGLWRGFPLPLITISIVRTISFTIYTSTKRILNSVPRSSSQASSPPSPSGLSAKGEDRQCTGGTANGGSKDSDRDTTYPWLDIRLGLFNRDSAGDVALTSLLAGGASGAVVCVGSAPFELVKVRRQLEYQIYRDSHPESFAPSPPNTSVHPPPNTSLPQHPAGTSASIPHSEEWSTSRSNSPASTTSASGSANHPPAVSHSTTARSPRPNPPPFSPPSTLQAVRLIVNKAGYMGLYTGWRLHFIRDTLGTALYFAEYDVMRYWLGRKSRTSEGSSDDGKDGGRWKGKGRASDEQGEVPEWARGWLPKQLIPFLCGSVAGVTSWALIYPVDAIKTKAQQRALSGLEPRTPFVQLTRLVRGADKDNPKPILRGIARLYRGLGVSMIRSMLTHGLLWTIVDWAGAWIDTHPFERLANKYEADPL